MSLASHLQEAASGSVTALVLETSLGRIWQHHRQAGFAIITAWRGERPEAGDDAKKLRVLNEKALSGLKSDIKSGGFGFTPVEGVGQEELGGKIIQAPEPSLLIPNVKRGGGQAKEGELRGLMLKLGKKYDQTAVLLHDPESGTEIVSPSGTVLDRAKKFSPNTIGQFFTRLRGNRTFRLEDLAWWGLRYSDPPGGWIEGMAMENGGRVRIAECSDRLADWLAEMGLPRSR